MNPAQAVIMPLAAPRHGPRRVHVILLKDEAA